MKSCWPAPPSLALLAALALGAVSAPPVSAQSAEEVLRTAMDRHQERMEGIQDYTVVQEVMGFRSTTYFEREERNGEVVFVPRMELGGGVAERLPDSPYGSFLELASRASHEGMEDVDGRRTHVVTATDLEGTSFHQQLADDDGELRVERITLWVDDEEHLLRRMRMEGTAAIEGGDPGPVTVTADLRDYREVEGMLHPFRTEISLEGFGEQISDEQREEIRQSLEEARQQMREMPESQREMMERMMGDQLEQMEEMLLSGSMDVTMTVEELRVNEGPPDDA